LQLQPMISKLAYLAPAELIIRCAHSSLIASVGFVQIEQ
jgi:hypothetical protein